MKKRKKIIIIGTIVIITAFILLPIIKIKSECKNGDELRDYQAHCEKQETQSRIKYEAVLPTDCRTYRNEYKPVIGKNGKKYDNSCWACNDCQKTFYEKKSILKILLENFKNTSENNI